MDSFLGFGRRPGCLLNLRHSGVRFVAVNMRDINETVVGIMAAIAQYKRETISARPKAAWAAAKARGVGPGNPRLSPGNPAAAAVARQGVCANADAFAAEPRSVIGAAREDGLATLEEFAVRLNEFHDRRVAVPRGRQRPHAGCPNA
jgi:hypothetical protein